MNSFRRILLAATVTGLSACSLIAPPPSTAIMPPGALGTNGDIDVWALNIAAFEFAHPIRGNPGRAANAIAALDYLGGELNTNPRWIVMPSLSRLQMLEARETVRAYVGISQAASSQAVVDTMLALARAYGAGDQTAVQTLLAAPIFVDPPAAVQARLNDIPLMPAINNVTTRADGIMSDFDMSGG
jgi:hypothetical protein